MNVLINNNGTNKADVLGANMYACNIKINEIMGMIEHGKFKSMPDIFKAILGKNGLNDAEKLIVFHIVCKIMDSSVIIIQAPKQEEDTI